MEVEVLACRVENRAPQAAVEREFLAFGDGELYGHQRIGFAAVDVTDYAACTTCHCGVYCCSCEHIAANGIGTGSGDASYGISGVEIFNGDFTAFVFEVFCDFGLEEFADVFFQDIS